MELPAVLHTEVMGDRARVELDIQANLRWFEGHFPDHPVLPGVVQLAWAVHFSRQTFGCGPEVSTLEQIKFKRPITSGRQVALLLRRHNGVVRFEYRNSDVSLASGMLTFKPCI